MRVWTDSTATIGICGRQGLGKLRHVDTQCLWIQQRVRDDTLTLLKVRGEDNPADLFTKHLVGADRIDKLLELFSCSFRDGRAKSAPTLRAGKGTSKGELLAAAAADLGCRPSVGPSCEEGRLSDQGTVPGGRWADVEDDEHNTTITWCDHVFNKSIAEDGTTLLNIPDAYPTQPNLLPHQHDDLEALFPRALAAPAAGDRDPDEDLSLEKVGWRVGIGSLEERHREEDREEVVLADYEKNGRGDGNETGTPGEEGVGLLAGAVGAVLPVLFCDVSCSPVCARCNHSNQPCEHVQLTRVRHKRGPFHKQWHQDENTP